MINEFSNKKLDIRYLIPAFHMMLRDLRGDLVTNEIKNWIVKKNNIKIVNFTEREKN